MKIQLYNRDGADLQLVKIRDIEPFISEWKLEVDSKHEYCLEHIRVIFNGLNIEAIDPSGGPYLYISDELDYNLKSYKIVNITSNLTLWLSERNNNN
jgi:hypothetical protein